MRKASMVILGFAALLLIAPASADAQGRGRNGRGQGIPPGHLPPPGECRVWHDGVPPGKQPPPTSCAEAERAAARTGARVIYGDDRSRGSRRSSGEVRRGSGGGGVLGDILGRTRDRRDDDDSRDRAGSRERGNRPATGRAIPRRGDTRGR